VAVVERLLVIAAALAAGVWLALGLHSASLEEDAQRIAARPPAALSQAEVARAVDMFERSRANNPDTRTVLREAGLLARRARFAEAVRLLEPVVRREPRNVNAWTLLSIAASKVDGRLSRRAADRARRLNPLSARRPPSPLPPAR
jgi:predicted Zn-dependent protease